MFFLCVYLFLSSVYTYEVTTKPNSSEKTDIHNLPINVTRVLDNGTKVGGNDTITTQRITQPLQIQKVERILETHTPLNASLRLENENGSLTNFKPSPQLETYYEFNKFPVIPALPEAKTFGGFNNPGYSVNSWDEKPTATVPWSNYQSFQNSWYENPRRQNSWGEINVKPNPNPTTGQPWVSRVKFPSSAANEDPYKFVSNDNKLNSYLPPVSFPTTTESFSFNKPVETPNRNIGKPSPAFWQKLMGNGVNKNAVAIQKTFLDYNIMEKPPQYGTPDKEYEAGISPHGSPNPWKKIIKLLTAIIPIGLFISALTPTVISVTSVNDT